MNKNKFFEKVTGLKPNNEILQILENLNYEFDFENNSISIDYNEYNIRVKFTNETGCYFTK